MDSLLWWKLCGRNGSLTENWYIWLFVRVSWQEPWFPFKSRLDMERMFLSSRLRVTTNTISWKEKELERRTRFCSDSSLFPCNSLLRFLFCLFSILSQCWINYTVSSIGKEEARRVICFDAVVNRQEQNLSFCSARVSLLEGERTGRVSLTFQ
jgi:hypothetical protein